ncbi:MAG TPA: transcriptional regulator [Candidatus Ruthenibacterium merdigallinarum]|nr:transcriptional regulator [Candidatus Ruthenibacterium merdigallinarum]
MNILRLDAHSQEGKQAAPRMAMFVTRTEDEKKLAHILDALHVPVSFQCRASGTAPSELLDIFGLGGTARLVTAGFVPRGAVRALFAQTGRELGFHRRGGGIVFTVPVTGLLGPLYHLLCEETRALANGRAGERTENDMEQVEERSRYNVIWASVSAGCSDDVIDAARAAGAKGGTVLHGRRRVSPQASAHFGIPMQDEQEFVMIVVPREKKTDVMAAIGEKCGLHSPAHGMVLSLPIDEAIGLEG